MNLLGEFAGWILEPWKAQQGLSLTGLKKLESTVQALVLPFCNTTE